MAADGDGDSDADVGANRHNEGTDMGWGMLELDISPYMGKTEKVNVTLPAM
jgi:hypothetical protein